MIQVCLCGAGTKKAKAPTVPYTADELAEQIVACAKAGRLPSPTSTSARTRMVDGVDADRL